MKARWLMTTHRRRLVDDLGRDTSPLPAVDEALQKPTTHDGPTGSGHLIRQAAA